MASKLHDGLKSITGGEKRASDVTLLAVVCKARVTCWYANLCEGMRMIEYVETGISQATEHDAFQNNHTFGKISLNYCT